MDASEAILCQLPFRCFWNAIEAGQSRDSTAPASANLGRSFPCKQSRKVADDCDVLTITNAKQLFQEPLRTIILYSEEVGKYTLS